MLLETLEYLGLGISNEEILYIEKELYKETGNIKSFKIDLIVELFDFDNQL